MDFYGAPALVAGTVGTLIHSTNWYLEGALYNTRNGRLATAAMVCYHTFVMIFLSLCFSFSLLHSHISSFFFSLLFPFTFFDS